MQMLSGMPVVLKKSRARHIAAPSRQGPSHGGTPSPSTLSPQTNPPDPRSMSWIPRPPACAPQIPLPVTKTQPLTNLTLDETVRSFTFSTAGAAPRNVTLVLYNSPCWRFVKSNNSITYIPGTYDTMPRMDRCAPHESSPCTCSSGHVCCVLSCVTMR